MKKFFFYSVALFFLISCGSNNSQQPKAVDNEKTTHDILLTHIDSIETEIRKNMKTGALDGKLAALAVNNYVGFAMSFPKDTNSVNFLYRASDIYASAMKDYTQSAAILEKIIQNHPDFKKLPMCYFQLGVIYDDNLNDDAKAKIYYEEFLKRYPDHKLAPQVKTLISYLGKSNDDLLKEFEKKNK